MEDRIAFLKARVAELENENSRLKELLQQAIEAGKRHKESSENALNDIATIIQLFKILNEILHFDQMIGSGGFNAIKLTMAISKVTTNPEKHLAPFKELLPEIKRLIDKYGHLIKENTENTANG